MFEDWGFEAVIRPVSVLGSVRAGHRNEPLGGQRVYREGPHFNTFFLKEPL